MVKHWLLYILAFCTLKKSQLSTTNACSVVQVVGASMLRCFVPLNEILKAILTYFTWDHNHYTWNTTPELYGRKTHNPVIDEPPINCFMGNSASTLWLVTRPKSTAAGNSALKWGVSSTGNIQITYVDLENTFSQGKGWYPKRINFWAILVIWHSLLLIVQTSSYITFKTKTPVKTTKPQ